MNSRCRVCGVTTDDLIDLFDLRLRNSKELCQFLILSTGIQLKQTDAVSSFVCHHCCIIAVKFYKYRVNAIANDKKLKEQCGQLYIPPIIDQEELHRLNASILDSVNTIQPDNVNSSSVSKDNTTKPPVPQKVLANVSGPNPKTTKNIKENLPDNNIQVQTQPKSKLYVVNKSYDKQINNSNQRKIPVPAIPVRDSTKCPSSKQYALQKFREQCKRKFMHSSVKRLLKKHQNLILPLNVISSDISPMVSLDDYDVNEWFKSKGVRFKRTSGKSVQIDLAKLVSSEVLKNLKIKHSSVTKSFLQPKPIKCRTGTGANNNKENTNKQDNTNVNIPQELLKKLSHFSIRIVPVTHKNGNCTQGTNLPGTNTRIFPVIKNPTSNPHKETTNTRASITKETPKAVPNTTKSFLFINRLTGDVTKNTLNQKDKLIGQTTKDYKSLTALITKALANPENSSKNLQDQIPTPERNEKRKRTPEFNDKVIPQKKNKVCVNTETKLQKVYLPQKKIPIGTTVRKQILTPVEHLQSLNSTVFLPPPPEKRLVLEKDCSDVSPLKTLLALPSQATSVHVCHMCNTIYDTPGALKQHERMHLRCKFCQQKMHSVASLIKHQSEECFINITKNLPTLRLHRIDSVPEIVQKYHSAFRAESSYDDIDYLRPLNSSSDAIAPTHKKSTGQWFKPTSKEKNDLSKYLASLFDIEQPQEPITVSTIEGPTVIVCISDDSGDEDGNVMDDTGVIKTNKDNTLTKKRITSPLPHNIVDSKAQSSSKIKPIISLLGQNCSFQTSVEEEVIRLLFKKHFQVQSRTVENTSQTFSANSDVIKYTNSNIILLEFMYQELFDYKIPVCLEVQPKIYASFTVPPLPEAPAPLLDWDHILPCDVNPIQGGHVISTDVCAENVSFGSVICTTVPSSTPNTAVSLTPTSSSTFTSTSALTSPFPVIVHSSSYTRNIVGEYISLNINNMYQKEQGCLNINEENHDSVCDKSLTVTSECIDKQQDKHNSKAKSYNIRLGGALLQNVNSITARTELSVNDTVPDKFILTNPLDQRDCVIDCVESRVPDLQNLNKTSEDTPSATQASQVRVRVKNLFELNQMVFP